MGLRKRVYKDKETIVTADNLNDIQDAVIALEDGLFSVDNDKSGEVITITDAANRGFRSLSIFGKTTQDGTPTPDAPVDLVSVGDSGSITVTVNGENETQSMTIATPNGLPGIPVSSSGNYTDENGQKWACDEKDFARGVYVQRILRITFDQIKEAFRREIPEGSGFYRFDMVANANPSVDIKFPTMPIGMCNALKFSYSVLADNATDNCISTYYKGGIFARYDSAQTAEEFLQTARDEKWEVLALLETPIETPLPEEELAAYDSLRTYKHNTTVSNDASAYMELEYVMDSKKYFESLVGSSTGLLEATVE